MTGVPERSGLWCESTVGDLAGGGEWLLAGYTASTPRIALRWLTVHAVRLADRISPPPDAAWVPDSTLCPRPDDGDDPAGQLRHWAAAVPDRETVLAALREGSMHRITVRDAALVLSLSVRPLLVPGASVCGFGPRGSLHCARRA